MEKFISILVSLKEFISAKSFISIIVSSLVVLFGQNIVIIQALFILIIVDLITGIFKSLKSQCKITSRRLLETVKKTILYALFLIATNQCVRISSVFNWVHIFTASFLAITELLSIIENLAAAGIIIPKWVLDRLHRYLDTGRFSSN